MDGLQRDNLREIEGLNQRGECTLSFVDLICAGTMSAEMVGYCWTAIANGASFLTAARPGGAGKSTVLANLLALLPPGERIATYGTEPDGSAGRANHLSTCALAHEIGSGHWFGYIWGAEVREFLSLKAHGRRLAACLHADTLDEVMAVLGNPPLSCSSEQKRALDLLLFIHVLPEGRRVVALHEATAEGYRQVFGWDADRGEPVPYFAPTVPYDRRLAAVQRLVAAGEPDFATVRAAVLAEYEQD